MKLFGCLGVFAFLFVIMSPATVIASDEELEKVRAAIKTKKAKWVAGKTSISELSKEEKALRQGLTAGTFVAATSSSYQTTAVVPASLDWRNVNGVNYVSPVKNQGGCGSCWAFGSTAVLESQVLIGGRSSNYDLSEQILMSCGNAGSCGGGSHYSSAAFFVSTGIPSENFYPYTATDGSCGSAGTGWQNFTERIDGYRQIERSVAAYEEAITTYGPIVGTMQVMTDFDYYRSGIYQHTSGEPRGWHVVAIVGFDRVNQYFIVKNSWGEWWGDGGYVKMGYSEFNSQTSFGALGAIAYYSSNLPPSIGTASVSPSPVIAGLSAQVRWTYTGNPGSTVRVDLLKGGLLHSNLSTSTSMGSSGIGYFSWSVPSNIAPGSDYQVLVTSTMDSNYNATSANFTIDPAPPPPTSPENVTATLTTYREKKGGKRAPILTGVSVSFSSSQSVAGVSYYVIYRNGNPLVNQASLSYLDKTTVAGGTYTYSVEAVDRLGQRSPMSATVSVSR